jgi:hypothetical protein
LDAYVATVDIKNLDQLKANPDAEGKRAEILIAHTDFEFVLRPGRKSSPKFPVLLVVGYSNRSEEFDESLPEFRDLLSRIYIDGRSGGRIKYLCGGAGCEDALEDPQQSGAPRP